jgi:hypothetical protein
VAARDFLPYMNETIEELNANIRVKTALIDENELFCIIPSEINEIVKKLMFNLLKIHPPTK